MDIVCPHSDSSVLARRKTRPPPLQIIPELSENILDIDATHSLATARPAQFVPRQPELVSSRITLSAYTFSIDDALFMLGGDAPRSPALSASSSTSDCTSSEDVPTTPGTSDDEDPYDFMLPTPRLRPQRISIRPLCITKTRSLICQENEDIHNYFEKEEEKSIPFAVTEKQPEHPTEAKAATKAAEEAEQDFYTREFEDFISLSLTSPFPTSPARRDSFILVAEALPTVIEVPQPKPRGRSRHSKPLPLLPPATPPVSSLPSIPTFPLVQTTAQESVVRRKRNIPPLPNYLPPVESRPLPRMAVPMDIEDCVFLEEHFDITSRGSIVTEQAYDVEEDASIYSQPSFTCTVSATTRPLPPAIQETLLSGMYNDVALPRSSTDSDAPRSSIDSTSSFTSSSSNIPILPYSFLDLPSSEDHEPESTQRLRSRWSSSTLASLPAEPTRMAILSPLRSVLNSRVRRVPLPSQKVSPLHPTPPKLPKYRHGFSTTPSPPSTPSKPSRRQGSRSSASSAGTSSSECDSHDGSLGRQKRKPIPMLTFLRGT
jgi:hypothetical protein